jgi:hypothetical protein
MNISHKDAMDRVTATLKADPDMFIAFQANIAVQFQDECARRQLGIDAGLIHQISNAAAERFLNELCRTAPADLELTGAEEIAEERREHIVKHGWDETHDDYSDGDLVKAALFTLGKANWPWGWEEYYRDKITSKNPIGKLRVAGSFIAAEIDRLKALAKKQREKQIAVVLPKTLDEAVEYILPRFKGMEQYAAAGETYFLSMCSSHLLGAVGMQIRNELKLWIHESPLHQYFLSEHRLFNPDDMSRLILQRVYQKIKPITGNNA